jgi:hypothetical protein
MSAAEEIKRYRLRPHRATEMAFQIIRAEGVSEDQDRALTKIENNYTRLMTLCDRMLGEMDAVQEELVRVVRQECKP